MGYTILKEERHYYRAQLSGGPISKTRTENLDNITELNEFAEKGAKDGYKKLFVKSYNSQGFRRHTTRIFDGQTWNKI